MNKLFYILFILAFPFLLHGQNNALHFDGGNDFVSVSDNPLLDFAPGSSMTIEAWVKRTSTVGVQHIIGKRVGSTNQINYQLVQDGSQIAFGGMAGNGAGAGVLLPLNGWVHVAGVYNGSVYKIYVNGALLGTSPPQPLGNPNNAPLTLGESGVTGFPFGGALDEVRIWNHARTQAEISASMNCELAGNETGLIACYNFNQGIAGGNNAGVTILNDLTANNLDGTLQNFALNGTTSNWVVFGASLNGSCTPTDVTLRLVDQNGDLIPASQFSLLSPPGGTYPQESTVSLAPGTYSIRLFPGINGQVQGSILYRDEAVVVSGASQVINFVWKTAPVQVTIVDQNNTPIPGSLFEFRSGSGSIGVIPNGGSMTLPVTEDPASPPTQGFLANGYPGIVIPGVNGSPLGCCIYRTEAAEELEETGDVRVYVWKTAPVQVTIVDQNTVPIPGSLFEFRSGSGSIGVIPNGGSMILPVTEDPSSPPIEGNLANGYPGSVLPGIYGQPAGCCLARSELAEELDENGDVRVYSWEVANGELRVVDASENEVCGASISQSFLGTISSGTSASLPISDPTVYTSLFGNYAGGYTNFFLKTNPGGNFEGPFTLSLNTGGIFNPAFVTISGNQYGLRFNLPASQQADPDEDGICAAEDNCPLLANVNQENNDGDGAGDICDPDDDNDGSLDEDDCEPFNPSIHPNALEICGNNVDEDCDGQADENCGPPLTVNAGTCQSVYYGYPPSQCTTLTAVASGGTPPYTFAWSTGATTASISVCPTATTIYTVTATDANNNTSTDNVTVEVVDVRCGNNLNKVNICHIPPGNPNNANTLCVAQSAVAAHLAHGDYLGACGTQPCSGGGDLKVPSGNNGHETALKQVQQFGEGHVSEQLTCAPNPFNGEITFHFNAPPESMKTNLTILDSRGQIVDWVLKETPLQGKQQIVWQSDGLLSGIYFVRLKMEELVHIQRIVLIR